MALTTVQAVPNVVAWGNNDSGQTQIPAGLTNAVAVAGGQDYSLALKSDGTVVAWGAHWNGFTYVPMTPPASLSNVVSIGAGYSHCVALHTDGTVTAWGYPELGNMDVPLGLNEVVAIAVGYVHNLALRSDGTVVAWGYNTSGNTVVPAEVTNVVAIAAGLFHSLALRSDGTVITWGADCEGAAIAAPVGLTNVVAIAGGCAHSLALKSDGTVVAWGENLAGQLNVPASLKNVVTIAAGETHSLALKEDGTVTAWGSSSDVPAGLTNVATVASGWDHNLAVVGVGAPVVIGPYLEQTILAGGTTYWRVAASGSQPVSYQWQFNGTNLPGATRSWLLLTNLQLTQAGAYAVSVSNAFGSSMSSTARLDLVSALILSQPTNQVALLGGTVTFTVEALANAPLSYQWRLNGTNLPDTTNSTLVLPSLKLEQAGSYSVVVGNIWGAITSQEAELVVRAAATRYVWQDSPSPAPPFTNWSTAAHVIQDVVDAALEGDTVLVAGGVYATGGRPVTANMTNRVAIDRAITVESLMGPEVTIIQGYQVPDTTNGDSAIRCVYLAKGASLSGFTLANGATRSTGNDQLEWSGGGVFCESPTSVVSNCVVTGNSANSAGGGIYGGTMNNCALSANSASNDGGGAAGDDDDPCTLNNCTLNANSAYNGGAAAYATLHNCTLMENSASYGGGAYESTLNNCTLTANSALFEGGAAYDAILNSCALVGNSAGGDGGGAFVGTLNNCTLTGNSAVGSGGGASGSYGCYEFSCFTNRVVLNNCILYFNSAPVGPNFNSYSQLSYCDTTPLPSDGIGNISLDPQLASASHLSAASPCRATGNTAYAAGTDIDGEAWGNPPSIGCDEYHAGALTGTLTIGITPSFTNVVVGYPVEFTALIQGRTTSNSWDFGDGITATNLPYTSHAWMTLGDYAVILRAYNESLPGGINTTVMVHVVAQPIHYVAADSGNPVPPYVSWATAATNIQDAVDAATLPGSLVLVTNGIYGAGGFPESTYRVSVVNSVLLSSVNGPQFTVVDGGSEVGCVYLGGGAFLSGFTLTNGVSDSGGGVFCGSTSVVVSNCVLTGNSASYGGGAYGGTLNNCILTGNSAGYYGGGARESTLTNCTLNGNQASSGGGISGGILVNCTLNGNLANQSGGGAENCTLKNCILNANSAGSGGGAYGGTLNNCTLMANSAIFDGGAAYFSTLNGCTLSGNLAAFGGGASGGILNNCMLTANSATNSGGGASGSTLNNCIVYFNSAKQDANYDSASVLNFCCATPLPPGTGNIFADPKLTDSAHLSASSPCVAAGSAAFISGVDIDGESWANPPSIGCDEFHAGSVTGPLTVAVAANYTNVVAGLVLNFTAQISGNATLNFWDFDDGTFAFDQAAGLSHRFTRAGEYAVTLRAYNDGLPNGIGATVVIHVSTNSMHYVSAGSTNPVVPYLSWATAATNIQDAIEAAFAGGAILVTNGTYVNGGRVVSGITNRVVVDKPLTVQSVNGPQFTLINGGHAARCVYLADDTDLTGFTLTNGIADSGGGVWSEMGAVVSNCVMTGNSAINYGGGAYGSRLNNCTLSGNSATDGGGAYLGTLDYCILSQNSARGQAGHGGGVYGSTLNFCTLTQNVAGEGGGAYAATLTNCTLTANSATTLDPSGGGAFSSILKNCTLIGNLGSQGGGAYNATLISCMLSNNSAHYSGGGAYGGTLNNCLLISNKAQQGGGAYAATLNNCALTRNSANSYGGGGVAHGTLQNCTLSGNSASYGGGVYGDCTLNNCIVYFNTASTAPNYSVDYRYSIFNHCCTTPAPTKGVGNLTNAPLLVDYPGGNLRLQSNSPCINAGFNGYAPAGPDLDDNQRISGGTVDIGAFEFQSPASVISYAWLRQFGLPTDGSADFADADGDGLNNWQEWRAGTNPTNADSALRVLNGSAMSTNVTVTWQSVAGVNYFVERSSNLELPFTAWASNIVGQAGTTSYVDTNAICSGTFFYRVGVQSP
jgi:hypothetical protein